MRALISGLFVVFWSVAVAASGSFGDSMSNIDGLSWAWVVGFSVAGGVLSLLWRVPKPGLVTGHLAWQAARDIVGSMGAGLLVFLFAEARKMDHVLIAGLITLGGWGGAEFIQRLYQRLLRFIDGEEEPKP